jgi:hypothetical protein
MKTEDLHKIVYDLNMVLQSKRKEKDITDSSSVNSYLTVVPRVEQLFGPIKRISISLTYNGYKVVYVQREGRAVNNDEQEILLNDCIEHFISALFTSLLDHKDDIWEKIIENKYHGIE